MEYTFIEYTDMHLMYGLASCNTLEAKRLYHEIFLNRTLPSQKTFERVEQRLRENGGQFILIRKVWGKSTDAGLRKTVHTLQLVENILNAVHDTLSTRTRRLSTQLNASNTIVHKVLKEQMLYPYHLQKVHELIPEDFPRRMQFAHWLLDQQRNNVNFISYIFFTEEASFTKNGITNLHNAHIWADEKPHTTVVSHCQHQFQSINIWAEIIGNFFIAPFVLLERLNGQLYLEFLQNDFPDFIEDLPIDKSSFFFSVSKWIPRGGPSRCPDLTPMDFHIWSHMKTVMYEATVNTRHELRDIIIGAIQLIQNMLTSRVAQTKARKRVNNLIPSISHSKILQRNYCNKGLTKRTIPFVKALTGHVGPIATWCNPLMPLQTAAMALSVL
ncbi:hypothetical protein NQ318_001770 [Aromia moschata]|uniref:DUF4817 domain-containing protein n=1 Tax=Aromia moschata TaxID=1265417 RepID=A0AAV8Y864_9CUCU|nr:hypothetical protein NQ318_001770 [Aromia moschata]